MRSISINLPMVWVKLSVDCDLDPFTSKYCLQRLKNEGVKFWTVTLPKLASVVLLGIERGNFTVARNESNFTALAWQGSSLRYFRSLLRKIFCLKTGDLLEEPSAVALRQLRQLCEYIYKLSLDFDPKVLETSSRKYEQTQHELACQQFDLPWLEKLRKNAETYYPELFRAHTHDVLAYRPRFGPGSFAGSTRCDAPFYEWKVLPDDTIGTCSNDFRGHSGYFKPYPDSPTRITLTGNSSRMCEVLFVPKDSRGPRVISKEPPHVIKPQMAFFAWCASALSNSTKGRIQFRDQSVNRGLAQQASIDKKHATLDMKDASDRIRYSNVLYIFRNAPGARFFLRNVRSTHYTLPKDQHGICRSGELFSVAGMGSGLTFPIMAFYIHLSVCSSISSMLRLPYKEVARRAYVYGDDLIIPCEWVDAARVGLTKSGMILNVNKSYVKGPFRESCGGDYLQGIECSPTRLRLSNAGLPKVDELRSLILSSQTCREPDSFILGLVKHAQELRKAGWLKLADYYETVLSSTIPMPKVGEGSPALGIRTESDIEIVKQGTWSKDLGYSTVKAVFAVPQRLISGRMCPYKFLGSFLNRQTSTTDLESSGGSTYGEIPIPRKIRLIIRDVSVSVLAKASTIPNWVLAH